MRIQNYQVLQRDGDGKARIVLDSGELLELPVGGPYEVGGAKNVLVGDLWLLAGQSNMQGIGDMVDVESPSPFVHSLTSREIWDIAKDPLHGWSPRLVHHLIDGRSSVPEVPPEPDPNPEKGAGLGLTFAKIMYEKTGVPVGLIPAAHGGTSMAQWDPALKCEGDASLYGAALGRIKDVGGKVAGILWYQGESDTEHADILTKYPDEMNTLINSFRNDLGQPDLPFYYVQIGTFIMADNPLQVCGWSAIQEAQRLLDGALPNVHMVSSVDLGLDDLIHIGTPGLKRLGKRLASVALGNLSPQVKGVKFEKDASQIRIAYSNVRGSLQSPGLPTGFVIRKKSGEEFKAIYKTILDGDTVILRLITNELPEGASLWYGWGMCPYCNITDSEDSAVPAFGPILLES